MSEPTKEHREILSRLWTKRIDYPLELEFVKTDEAIPERLFRLGLIVQQDSGESVGVTALGVAYLKATEIKPPYYEWLEEERRDALELLLEGWHSQEAFREDVRGYLLYDGGSIKREVFDELVGRGLAEQGKPPGYWGRYRINQAGREILAAIDAFDKKYPHYLQQVNPKLEDLKDAMRKHERAWERCMIYYHEKTEQEITASMRIADKFNESLEHAITRMRRWATKDRPIHPAFLEDIADELEELLGKG